MPNMDAVKQQIFDLYQCLDLFQSIVPIIGTDFMVPIPGLKETAKLPQDRIDSIKNTYIQTQAKIKNIAISIPTKEQLGL